MTRQSVPFARRSAAVRALVSAFDSRRHSCYRQFPMQSPLADHLDAWHDFDVLIGTAAATLVGLMFVAASIGASVFTEKDRAAMEAFISPTVVHFSAVLFVAILSLVPSHEWPTLAGLL